MQDLDNQVGNQDNWAKYITNVEMRDQQFLSWLPVGDKPVNPLYNYQADKFRTPKLNSHVDGKPWTEFENAGDGRGNLKSLVQWLSAAVSVSKLTQDVTDPAGVADELAREIPKKLKEMATDLEANCLDDHDGREDNKVSGYLTRSVGSWVNNSAQALYPVPSDFRTPAASISATASGSVNENDFRNIFESIASTTKSNEAITGHLGLKLKRKFSDFQFYLPSSTSTQASGVHFNQNGAAKAILRAVDTYDSDCGQVDLMLNYWLANITGTAVVQQYRGYFLHRSKWEMRWNQKPRVYKPEFKGGSYEAAMDCISMLVCKNPKGEGKYAPTA